MRSLAPNIARWLLAQISTLSPPIHLLLYDAMIILALERTALLGQGTAARVSPVGCLYLSSNL